MDAQESKQGVPHFGPYRVAALVVDLYLIEWTPQQIHAHSGRGLLKPSIHLLLRYIARSVLAFCAETRIGTLDRTVALPSVQARWKNHSEGFFSEERSAAEMVSNPAIPKNRKH